MRKLFSFDGASSGDEHASNPGAQNVPTGAGAVASSERTAASEAANAELSMARQARRGRPRKDSGDRRPTERDLQEAINAQIASQLDGLYAPEAWGALLGLPADAALTWTGNQRWKLGEDERKTLGATGSAAARTMMITNPKALAFSMLAATMFAVYVPRAVAQLKELREKEAAKKKEEPKT